MAKYSGERFKGKFQIPDTKKQTNANKPNSKFQTQTQFFRIAEMEKFICGKWIFSPPGEMKGDHLNENSFSESLLRNEGGGAFRLIIGIWNLFGIWDLLFGI